MSSLKQVRDVYETERRILDALPRVAYASEINVLDWTMDEYPKVVVTWVVSDMKGLHEAVFGPPRFNLDRSCREAMGRLREGIEESAKRAWDSWRLATSFRAFADAAP